MVTKRLARPALPKTKLLSLKERTIFWLSQKRDKAAQDLLYQLYDEVKDQKIKESLIFAFSQANSKAAIHKLIEIARKQENLSLRKKALF